MDIPVQSPLCLLRRRLPHKGGDWLRHPTSPLVGEGPRSCAAEGGSQKITLQFARPHHAPAL